MNNTVQEFPGCVFNEKMDSILIMGVSLGLIYLFFTMIPAELSPLEDRSGLRIFATAPEGASFDYMDHFMDKLIQTLKDSIPERDAIISVTSPGFGASSSVNSGFRFCHSY